MTRPVILISVTDPITAQLFLRGQLTDLKRSGFDPHLACAMTPDLGEFAKQEGVIVHAVPLSRGWVSPQDLRALATAVRVLRATKPAVLNYSTPKAALIWAIASWFSRPPAVVFLLRGLRMEGESRRNPKFWILWLMELIAARTSDVTVCVSHGLRAKAISLRLISRRRSRVLGAGSSNGVDASRFGPISAVERQEARSRLAITDAAFVVGYSGRFSRDKGIADLLDAMQLCGPKLNLTCVLVGFPEPDFDLCAEVASRPEIADRVIVQPATRQVSEVYAALDCFVLPSHREGMSNALLEAQARGLPCVTTDATGCVDAIEPGVTGWVVPAHDSEALARGLVTAARDIQSGSPSIRGEAGRERVVRLFAQGDVWARYIDLYVELLNNATRSRATTEQEARA